MLINLTELDLKKQMVIKEGFTFESIYLKNAGIKGLEGLEFEGIISRTISKEIELTGKISGTMILKDAFTLEDVQVNLNIDVDETLEDEDKKNLDIKDILWQYIVLEVPISISKKNEPVDKVGDNWRFLEKEEENINLELASLQNLLDDRRE